MANTLVTCSIVAKEALAILENMLGFAANVNRSWQDEFTSNQGRGYSPGQTILIKRPPRYTYRAGRVSVPQSTVEVTVPLTLQQGGTDLNFTGLERTVSMQQFEQKIQAAVATVVNEIDRQGCDLARTAAFNAVGTPGTFPTTQVNALALVTQVQQRLDEMAAPRDKQRALILSPAMNASLVQGFAGLFNGQAPLAKQYGTGIMVDALGLSYAMDQNVVTQVNGAATATNINGAGQVGSNLTVVATASGTLTKGTKITLPGVFAVNPQSRISTNALMQFVLTADVLVGSTTLPLYPAITPTGAFQNVTASPTNGAPYVIFGAASQSYGCSVGFHKDAFTLAMVEMYTPKGGKGVVDVAVMSDNGLSVKVTQFYDGVNDNYLMRLDVLFGWAATYPELAVLAAA